MTAASGDVVIRRAVPDDAARLAVLAEQAFMEAFAADNAPADMAAYCAEAFGEAVQRAELEDPRHTVWIAEQGGDAVGYAVLRAGPAPESVRGADPIEIWRLYLLQRAVGSGLGAALMQQCLAEAAAAGRGTVWLGVWEHNARARAFYRRWGFTETGSYTFVLGRDPQTDLYLSRPVEILP